MSSLSGFYHRLVDRLPLQEKINFARHLSLVTKAGLPIFGGLQIIKSQTDNKILKKIVNSLIEDVSNGKFLADGLQKYQNIFGEFYINIIRVGEVSGTLSKNLLYLAEELQKSKAMRSKIRSAMVYPVVILVATVGVTGFLAFFVFPKLLPILTGLNVKLPITTVIMIAFVNFLQVYFFYIVVGVIVFVVGARMLIDKIKPIRYAVDRSLLSLPALGSFSMSINVSNFCRVLGILLKSGVKIVEALEITSNTMGNFAYRMFILKAKEEVRKGGQLSAYLAKEKSLFPPLVSGMIRVGEDTGNLEDNLDYISEYYADELDTRLKALTSIIEPLLLLVMGFIVGFIALAIITPIYSISQGVSQ